MLLLGGIVAAISVGSEVGKLELKQKLQVFL